MVFRVDKEDDAGYFREVVFPETTGCGWVSKALKGKTTEA